MNAMIGSKTVHLKIEGMECEGCARAVTRALSGVRGVSDVAVNLSTGRATFRARAGVSLDEAVAAVERAGYHASLN